VKTHKLFLAALLQVGVQTATISPAAENWSGHWLQNNQRSAPAPRNKSYTFQMDVELNGSQLQIHSSMNNGRNGDRKLDLTYEIGGKEIVYTGMDGDEFHAKARWSGDELLFTVVEHERGRLIPFAETWTLIDGGKSLRRVKVWNDPKEPRAVTVLERAP